MPSPSKVQLNVYAADDGAELLILDGQQRQRAQGRGHLSEHLPPGVYVVQATVGQGSLF